MIKTEYYMTRQDGVILNRSYSDRGVYIRNSEGAEYSEAIDPENMHRTYEETNKPLPDLSPRVLERMLKEVL